MTNQVIPSINCSNFACVKERISKAAEFVEWIHIDVSDGKFTPHISWNNPEELPSILRVYETLRIEMHLMVEDPEAQIDAWLRHPQFENNNEGVGVPTKASGLRTGVRRIIVHLEAMRDPIYIIERCKKYGVECFLAINSETEVERLLAHLDDFNGFLILGVFPGPSGQEMKPEVINKIKYLRENNSEMVIEIDGGVNLETAKRAKEAGANLFVAGNYIFGSANPQKAYADLQRIVG